MSLFFVFNPKADPEINSRISTYYPISVELSGGTGAIVSAPSSTSTAIVNNLTASRRDQKAVLVFPMSEVPDGMVSRSVLEWLTLPLSLRLCRSE